MTLVAPERPLDAGAGITVLWDEGPAPRPARGNGMPAPLAARYGGELVVPLRPDRPTFIANFVSTLDGIVAFGHGPLAGGGLISGFHEPDRFVMAVVRAVADVVLVGAGTVRGSASRGWTAEQLQPDHAADIARWRAAMGLARAPTTIVVSGRGDVPAGHPGLTDPSIPVVIATTAAGAGRLRDAGLPPHVDVRALGSGTTVGGHDLATLADDLGARLVLCEGGPHLFGELVAADLLDELFLTVAPQLVGRDGDDRVGLVEGVAFPPSATSWLEPVSVRRSGRHLFLRYRHAGRPGEHEES